MFSGRSSTIRILAISSCGALGWALVAGMVKYIAVPVPRVVDPTGAGDAFAGGLVVSLAEPAGGPLTVTREALHTASTMGALAVSTFSFQGLLDGGAG